MSGNDGLIELLSKDFGTGEEERTFPAETEQLYEVLSFVNKLLDAAGCKEREKKQIGMAVEEIFVNIASYAYDSGRGDVIIRIDEKEDPDRVEITIRDTGAPYNPLEHQDPDLGMDVEDRQKGGFGIFMVKKCMDDVQYCYENGQNRVTIVKNIHSEGKD